MVPTRGVDRNSREAVWSRFGCEAVQALGIAAVFVAVGLALSAIAADLRERGRERAAIAYAPSAMIAGDAKIWLVDGYNVLHAGVLGGRDRSQWWTESRRRELLERASRFDADVELWVVFDGSDDPQSGVDSRRARCVFAASADDWLVERVRRADDPSEIAVVTADRRVAGRPRGRGAQVVSPREFLARCARGVDA